MTKITAADYLKSCKRRFGTANPERFRVPVWEWMVRMGHNPFVARESLKLDSHFQPGQPDWCFDRLGAPRVTLPDGRVITIAGEHEDFYDPDFCIYNDVIVQRGDDVEIYGYPPEIFPPTDFHTATLVGTTVYIIGSLGYDTERGGSDTPVFRLDTDDYRIERVTTSGVSPGWIYKHRATYRPDARVIEITGGTLVLGSDESERFLDNLETYELDLDDGTWQQVTDHSAWRQFELEYADDKRTWEDISWYTGEILEQLGYPCELDDQDDDDGELTDRVHTIIVDGVHVLCSDRMGCVHLTVQGTMAQREIDELLDKIKALAHRTHRTITSVVELKR